MVGPTADLSGVATITGHRPTVQLLNSAVLDLDQHAARALIAEVVSTRGVVAAWTDVLAPALRLRGEEFGRTADGINVEHLLSECTAAALTAVAWQPRRRLGTRPVLLATPDGEQHTLALHALAAALAERGRPHVMLGASVPERALADAVARIEPAVIFLWAHTPETALLPAPASTHTPLVVGGPGWPEHTTGRVDTLESALQACITPIRPSRNGLPRPDHPRAA